MANPFTYNLDFGKYNHENQLTRTFGNHATFIDPYQTGYHFIFFTKVPEGVGSEAGKFLTTVCQSVTVPGLTVEPIEYVGLNSLKWSVPGAVAYDSNRFTAKFTEFNGLPITQIMGKWVTIFRNVMYGIADPDIGSDSQGDYKGKAIYATTTFGANVQFACGFSGVYPLKVPTDQFGSDVATQDKSEPEIEFSFDDMWTGDQVLSTARELIEATVSQSVSFRDDLYGEVSGS